MLLKVFKISGHSMMPLFTPNDKVLASSLPYIFSHPKKGDVVVFSYNKKILIKEIVKEKEGNFIVKGKNKKDSLKIGEISRKQILGKVIMKI